MREGLKLYLGAVALIAVGACAFTVIGVSLQLLATAKPFYMVAGVALSAFVLPVLVFLALLLAGYIKERI